MLVLDYKTNMADEEQHDNVEGEENILYDFTVQAEWPQDPETVVCSFYIA